MLRTAMTNAAHNGARAILVLGVGNIMRRDDGVGVRAVRALAASAAAPPGVRLLEGGVAGLRLLGELQRYADVLIIDAVAGASPPGTIYRLTPDELPADRGPFSAHDVSVRELVSAAACLGAAPRVRILGVQPLDVSIGEELTPPLRAALPHVVDAAIEELRNMMTEAVRAHV